jgi:uncharacterized repeat protein (TIGR04138 family)
MLPVAFFRKPGMQDLEFNEIIDLIHKEDSRFDKRAYHFVRAALDHTVKELKKREPERARKSQHVSGAELLHGMRTYAIEQFGPLAYTVLTDWGLCRCRDFGEIVFKLIEYSVLSKTESDSIDDFGEVFTFEDAFMKPFEPSRRRLPIKGVIEEDVD